MSRARGVRLEGSAFQGREPDEDRLDIDRLPYTRGRWYAQMSAGCLNEPEVVTPFDATRLTASVTDARGDEDRMLAWTAAFGQNREIHGNRAGRTIWGRRRRHGISGTGKPTRLVRIARVVSPVRAISRSRRGAGRARSLSSRT